MPWTSPTYAQVYARAKADVQGALGATAAFFKVSFERGITAALAAASFLQHGHLDWMARQQDPTKCDLESLIRLHCGPIGMTQKQAVKTVLRLSGTGVDGTNVTAGWIFNRADGQRYLVTTAGTVSGGVVSFQVTAETAGQLQNCEDGTPLLQGSPIAGLNDTCVVAETIVDGSDLETIEDLLQRFLIKKRTPIRGGAPGDYVFWTLEVPGVTRAWEYPKKEGAGTTTVYAVNDKGSPISLTPTKITEIKVWLDQAGKQPTQSTANVYTATLQAQTFDIHIVPDTPEVRTAVLAEIDEVLSRTSHPGGHTISNTDIDTAISLAPGLSTHDLIFPTGDVTTPFGSMPVRGSVTWS